MTGGEDGGIGDPDSNVATSGINGEIDLSPVWFRGSKPGETEAVDMIRFRFLLVLRVEGIVDDPARTSTLA